MTPAELRRLDDLIRTIRASARGTGILGPAALNLANAVEVLAGDHGRVLTLLGGARDVIRGTDAASSPDVAVLLRGIDEHLEKQT